MVAAILVTPPMTLTHTPIIAVAKHNFSTEIVQRFKDINHHKILELVDM